MTVLRLTDEYSLAIEHDRKKARWIFYKNGVENVCRNEPKGKIERFISSGDEQLFKGRLQLHKHANDLGIEVKGDSVGLANAGGFLKFLKE